MGTACVQAPSTPGACLSRPHAEEPCSADAVCASGVSKHEGQRSRPPHRTADLQQTRGWRRSSATLRCAARVNCPFTISNSAVSFLPRRVVAPGFFSLPVRTLVAADPDRGVAERREAPALHQVALVRRDATLARRGPSRATGTPPLGAPPWRCRPAPPVPGIAAGAGAKASAARHAKVPDCGAGLLVSAVTSRAIRRHLPAPPSGSSPEDAPP